MTNKSSFESSSSIPELDVYETSSCLAKLERCADDISAQLKMIVQHCLGLVSVQRWLRDISSQDIRLSTDHVVSFVVSFTKQKLGPALESNKAGKFQELKETIATLNGKGLVRGNIRLLVRGELPDALASQFVSFIDTADNLTQAWAKDASSKEALVELIQENAAAVQSLLQNIESLTGEIASPLDNKRKRESKEGDVEVPDVSKLARTNKEESCKEAAGQSLTKRNDDGDDDDQDHGHGHMEPASKMAHNHFSSFQSNNSGSSVSSAKGAETSSSDGDTGAKKTARGSNDLSKLKLGDLKESSLAPDGPLFTLKVISRDLQINAAKRILSLVHFMRAVISNSPSLQQSLRNTAIVIDSGPSSPLLSKTPSQRLGETRVASNGEDQTNDRVASPLPEHQMSKPGVSSQQPQNQMFGLPQGLSNAQQQQAAALSMLTGLMMNNSAQGIDPRAVQHLLAQFSGGLVTPMHLSQLMQWPTSELPLRIILQPCSTVHKSPSELEPFGLLAFGLEVSSADLARNEVVTIKVIRVRDAKPVQLFEHMIDGEPRFVFRRTHMSPANSTSGNTASEENPFSTSYGTYSGRRLFGRLQVDPEAALGRSRKVEYVLAVRVGNSDFVQTMPITVTGNTFDGNWVNSNERRKEIVRQFAQAYANQISVAENRFLACQPVIMPDRDVLLDVKENVLRLEQQYQFSRNADLSGVEQTSGSTESPSKFVEVESSQNKVQVLAGQAPGVSPGAAPMGPSSEKGLYSQPQAQHQFGSPSMSVGSHRLPNVNEVFAGMGFVPPMNLGYLLPGLSGLGSPAEQYNALLGTLAGGHQLVGGLGSTSQQGAPNSLMQSVGPREDNSISQRTTDMRRSSSGGFIPTASAANPQKVAVIRRDAEERLYRVVDFLRYSDKAPNIPLDDRHAQMFTWNENMSLLLCSLLQESCKNPFKSILRNFNRAVTDGEPSNFGGPNHASNRPVRDRSSLRKRLQKMLHREQLSKDWESTRRASANLFVNSAKKRLETEADGSLEFLRDPVRLIEEVFTGLNPSVPGIGINS